MARSLLSSSLTNPYFFSGASVTLSTTQAKTIDRIIDLNDSLADIAANLIYGGQYHDLPSDIFEELVLKVINDQLNDLAADPQKYLQPHHETELDRIAHQYLNS